MRLKQKVARKFVSYTHEWNEAIHGAIESNVHDAFRKMYPNGIEGEGETEKQIDSMRNFYYQRMMNTATLLLAGLSVLIAVIALIVALIAIHFS